MTIEMIAGAGLAMVLVTQCHAMWTCVVVHQVTRIIREWCNG